MLAGHGDLDGLRARADAGDGRRRRRAGPAAGQRGDLEGLRARADAGDTRRRLRSWPCCWPSAVTWTGCAPGPTSATSMPPWELAELLAERGDLDGLRARADAGDREAAGKLADLLLADRDDLDGLRTS